MPRASRLGPLRLAVALAVLGAAGAAHAQAWRITPSIAFSETYSDNMALVADEIARKGWITDITPGLRIDANGARLKGFLDYRFHEVRYSGARDLDSSQHVLGSAARLEAIEKFLFIDGRADITSQNRTPLQGAVPVNGVSGSDNRIETRTFQVSPNARGSVGDFATYQARYNASYVTTEDDTLPATRVGEFVGRIRNARLSARLGWAVDANLLRARNDAIGSLSDDRLRGLLIFGIDPNFNVAAIYGRETTDFEGSRQSENTPGLAFNWQPSPRSLVAGEAMKRFFGTGHLLSASYRTPRTAWRLTSVRDAAVLPEIIPRGAGNTNSLFALVNDLMTPAYGDPAERAEAARQRLEQAGVTTDFPLATGTVSSQPVVFESQAASVALLGTRNTVTLRFTRLDQRNALPPPPDASPLLVEDLRQAGVSATWAYRLTPLTTITGTATGLRTEDLGAVSATTRQAQYTLSLTSRLGPHTTASLGVRHNKYDSPLPLSAYSENAIVGTLQFRL